MAVAAHLVAEAIRLNVIRPEDAHRFLYDDPPDPCRAMSYAQRLIYVIRHAGSGAPAINDLHQFIEHIPTGRRLPPPTKEPR